MILLLWFGCAAPLTGLPSFTMMAPGGTSGAVAIGPEVTVEQCSTNVLGIFSWAAAVPSHEGVIAKALAETGADVLLNAELSTKTFNAYVYTQACSRVVGTPARFAEAT